MTKFFFSPLKWQFNCKFKVTVCQLTYNSSNYLRTNKKWTTLNDHLMYDQFFNLTSQSETSVLRSLEIFACRSPHYWMRIYYGVNKTTNQNPDLYIDSTTANSWASELIQIEFFFHLVTAFHAAENVVQETSLSLFSVWRDNLSAMLVHKHHFLQKISCVYSRVHLLIPKKLS